MINKKTIGIILIIVFVIAVAVGTAVATNVIPNPLIKTSNSTNDNITNNSTVTNIKNKTSNETNSTNDTVDDNSEVANQDEPNLKKDSDYEKRSSDEYVKEWDEATHKHDGSDFRMDQPYKYDDEGNIHLRQYNEKTGENYWS